MLERDRSRLWILLGGLATASCVDPESRYEDFIERTAQIRSPDAATSDAGPMEATDRFDWSGRYLLALSTVLSPDAPLLFAVEAEVSADLERIDLQLQPLTTDGDAEPRTAIGEAFGVSGLPYEEDGTFSADLGAVSVPGRANPITGADIVASVQLSASTRAADNELANVFCGEVAGRVTQPLMLDLSGSTFGALQTQDETTTDPLLRCP